MAFLGHKEFDRDICLHTEEKILHMAAQLDDLHTRITNLMLCQSKSRRNTKRYKDGWTALQPPSDVGTKMRSSRKLSFKPS